VIARELGQCVSRVTAHGRLYGFGLVEGRPA
jgi:hypothetical protein